MKRELCLVALSHWCWYRRAQVARKHHDPGQTEAWWARTAGPHRLQRAGVFCRDSLLHTRFKGIKASNATHTEWFLRISSYRLTWRVVEQSRTWNHGSWVVLHQSTINTSSRRFSP
jgi:hypothetical protein